MTSWNHMCCHSCNGSQEPFFNKTMLGLTRKECHKSVSALLLPFLGLPDPQICLQLSISGIIWDEPSLALGFEPSTRQRRHELLTMATLLPRSLTELE
ncbi:uncharacterized protein TNCV_3183171 [Trichonephila clavipes]|uniref:Uncharacterized protein n=1 Tax=Trichonephila clavipes TaxID=2585209 RepID=A0A8X6VG57_TRICX|nr:uncharacterized protein TNCV_3183171 [Trichonephila clavipes]